MQADAAGVGASRQFEVVLEPALTAVEDGVNPRPDAVRDHLAEGGHMRAPVSAIPRQVVGLARQPAPAAELQARGAADEVDANRMRLLVPRSQREQRAVVGEADRVARAAGGILNSGRELPPVGLKGKRQPAVGIFRLRDG